MLLNSLAKDDQKAKRSCLHQWPKTLIHTYIEYVTLQWGVYLMTGSLSWRVVVLVLLVAVWSCEQTRVGRMEREV